MTVLLILNCLLAWLGMLGSISINAGVSKCPARKAICSSVGCRESSWSKKLSEVILGASCVFSWFNGNFYWFISLPVPTTCQQGSTYPSWAISLPSRQVCHNSLVERQAFTQPEPHNRHFNNRRRVINGFFFNALQRHNFRTFLLSTSF